jgi:hypothetical protein
MTPFRRAFRLRVAGVLTIVASFAVMGTSPALGSQLGFAAIAVCVPVELIIMGYTMAIRCPRCGHSIAEPLREPIENVLRESFWSQFWPWEYRPYRLTRTCRKCGVPLDRESS